MSEPITSLDQLPLVCTVDQHLVPLTGLSRNCIYECIHRGELRAVRVGRRVVIPRHCVERWLLLDGASPELRP